MAILRFLFIFLTPAKILLFGVSGWYVLFSIEVLVAEVFGWYGVFSVVVLVADGYVLTIGEVSSFFIVAVDGSAGVVAISVVEDVVEVVIAGQALRSSISPFGSGNKI